MSTNDAGEVSLHSNVVTFTDQSETITSISYVADSLVISPGQVSQVPPTITQDGNVFTIELQAGRHKTTLVADQFNELCGGRNNEYAPSGGEGGTPDQLNFFFALEIQFQYEGAAATQTVYVGQGEFLSHRKLVDRRQQHSELRHSATRLHRRQSNRHARNVRHQRFLHASTLQCSTTESDQARVRADAGEPLVRQHVCDVGHLRDLRGDD